jgi:hypothetical protein
MCSAGSLQTSLWRSCLIRSLGVLRLYAAPPERFAGLRVLLRSSAPRHPPHTLLSLFFRSYSPDVLDILPYLGMLGLGFLFGSTIDPLLQ